MSISQTDYMQEAAAHLGWSAAEDALLFEQVQLAREQSKPLKQVFELVAQRTGRKPNSIRNYYYTRLKQGKPPEEAGAHTPAFVPFAKDEMWDLLVNVLGAQARGMSVRACTLELGGGDNRAMLRFQNKYRSLIKNSPELVKQVVEHMKQNGMPVFDPYEKAAPRARHAGRPKKNPASLVDIVSSVVKDLNKVEGLDVAAFFENLGALAVSAAKGATLLENRDEQNTSLHEQNEELRVQLAHQKQQIQAQRERFALLLGYFRQLMEVNREFLGMTSVVKMSSLGSYIRELSKNVENCEKWMVEYN